MEFEWFRSAGVGLHSAAGGSLLCDPWLNDGALLGSWFHWPPLEGSEPERILSTNWDAVYITHLHGDHYDRRFMSKLAKAQPKTKVVIADYAHPWLFDSLESIGFRGRIIRNRAYEMQEVAPGISMTAIPADHCDPVLCGANIPCVSSQTWGRAIDSLGLIEIDGMRIMNANDATTVVSSLRLYSNLPPIDLMLTAYAGASPFPQSFSNLSREEKLQAAQIKATAFLEKVARVSTLVRPQMIFPFAGQHMLGGSLTPLNETRGMFPLLDSARKLREMQDAAVFSLQPFMRVDLSEQKMDGDFYIEPPEHERVAYLERIRESRFPYQKRDLLRVQESDHLELLLAGMRNLAWRYEKLGKRYNKSLVVGSELGSATLNINGEKTEVFLGDSPSFECTKVMTDPRLLDAIIRKRPGYSGFTDAHMNVADGGNHLEWFREGPYNPDLTSLLFYL